LGTLKERENREKRRKSEKQRKKSKLIINYYINQKYQRKRKIKEYQS